VPGWVYFPSCESRSFPAAEPQKNLPCHATLQPLLEEAAEDEEICAVTTSGETKMALGPQVMAWCCRARLAPGQMSAAITEPAALAGGQVLKGQHLQGLLAPAAQLACQPGYAKPHGSARLCQLYRPVPAVLLAD
jgi:hypothetical protein